MKKTRYGICLLSILVFTSFCIFGSPLYADQAQNFDPQKVKQLKSSEKKSKSDVKALFGEPTSTAPIKKTEEGCIELWIYVEVVLEGYKPVQNEFLYIGFDESESVCSVEVKVDKM